MLAAIVRASLRNPRIVTALACLIAALGVAAVIAARFDVFPDFAPPHVLVQTEAPGLDATQVEALVTRPLEALLAGTENVKTLRSTSSQGLSAIQVVFDRGGDPYRQRQVVTERLAEFAGVLEGLGIRQSVGRTGICYDNALAESFNASLKVERVYRTAYPTRKKAKEDIARYIEIRYNRKRLHSALGYRTPQEAHDEYLNRQLAA